VKSGAFTAAVAENNAPCHMEAMYQRIDESNINDVAASMKIFCAKCVLSCVKKFRLNGE
jgi:hypothetical protein